MNTSNRIADDLYHHGFHIIDSFLPAATYHALCRIIRETEKKDGLTPAKIGKENKQLHENIRGDLISWLDNTSDHKDILIYLTAINTLKTKLNRLLFLGLMDYEAHFAVYPPGSFYKKHVDQFSSAHDRRISCVYYLNNDWQPEFGGELILHHASGTHILPLGNRFVCFNSNIPHEVKITHHTRYSITTWLKVRPLDPN